MAPKRKKSHGDGNKDADSATNQNGGSTTTPDFAKPVYLVAEHEGGEKTAYSVFKLDAAAAGRKRPRVHAVAALPNTARGMSFVTAHSIPIGGGVGRTYWCELPPPPFFPLLLNPYQFRYPPEISVMAYAAVVSSSHILVSGVSAQQAQQEQPIVLGTYAFHVVDKTWEKVHAENLPFVAQAVPLDIGGNNLFVACPVNNGAMAASASLFHISIKQASLSIEFPVAASEINKVPKPLFCPLPNGTFCSITLRASRRSRCKTKVTLTSFEIENIDAISTACQSMGFDAKDLLVAVKVMKNKYIYKCKDGSLELDSDTPMVAVLSM